MQVFLQKPAIDARGGKGWPLIENIGVAAWLHKGEAGGLVPQM
ncbi:hypothetical protein [Gymnodinialimonas hymeniacidonis]